MLKFTICFLHLNENLIKYYFEPQQVYLNKCNVQISIHAWKNTFNEQNHVCRLTLLCIHWANYGFEQNWSPMNA